MSNYREPAFVDPGGKTIDASQWLRLQLGEPHEPDPRVLAVNRVGPFIVETTWFGAYNPEAPIRTVWRTGTVDVVAGEERPTVWSDDREVAHATHVEAVRTLSHETNEGRA